MPKPRRARLFTSLSLPLLATGLLAAPNDVPARLVQARYIALGYDLGDSFLSEREALLKPGRVMPEDQRALNAVRDLIETWNRYVITARPEHADLFLAVRAGRRASFEVGVRTGGWREGSGATGVSSRAEVSSPDDMLSVYETAGGRIPLWRGQRPDGFSGNSPKLFEDFKADVERAARKP
jgi:hypothetical protein